MKLELIPLQPPVENKVMGSEGPRNFTYNTAEIRPDLAYR